MRLAKKKAPPPGAFPEIPLYRVDKTGASSRANTGALSNDQILDYLQKYIYTLQKNN